MKTALKLPAPSVKRMKEMLSEIAIALSAQGNEATVEKYKRYFKEGYDSYGVPTEAFTSIKKELFAKYSAELDLDGFLALGDRLVKTGKYEEGSLAMYWLLPFKKQWTKATLEHIGCWLEDGGYRNWAHVDCLCSEVIYEFFKLKIITEQDILVWREAESLWKRRAVPVSFVQMLQLKLPAKPLVALVEPLMHDQAVMVQKGVGWFLREAWKREPTVVEKLLTKHRETAPRLIYQYATEKMTPEQKDCFRRTKKTK